MSKYRRYGLSEDDVSNMIEEQDRKCYICFRPISLGTNALVDHDHTTNAVRAILCYQCNTGLGLFHDDPWVLRNAVEYLLERFTEEAHGDKIRKYYRMASAIYGDPPHLTQSVNIGDSVTNEPQNDGDC